MNLSDPARRFVLHWGEMGSRWGVNRSVAQTHALLFLSSKPLPADEIAETLGISRSNVSATIKELLAWRLIRPASILGDRREHFEAVEDGLEMVRLIVEGRRQREILPTIDMLETLTAEAEADAQTPEHMADRIRETRELMRLLDQWYRDMAALPRGTQIALLKMGARIARFLPKAPE